MQSKYLDEDDSPGKYLTEITKNYEVLIGACIFYFLKLLKHKETGEEQDFIALCRKWKTEMAEFLNLMKEESSDGELAAFASYALAFPDSFIALVDTYDTVR